MRNLKKFIPVIIFILPFCIGFIGYYNENKPILDSMYGAFALYAVNPVFDEKNILIEIARWSAPAVLASGLILVLKNVIRRIINFFRSFHKDAVAVYSDNEQGGVLVKNIKHGILVKRDKPIDVKNHILIFSDDEKNLAFYEKYRKKLAGKDVAVKLDADDVFKTGAQNAHFFNISEIIARRYWVERNLLRYFTDNRDTIKIAVVGFGNLGQRIFTYGVLNNIYSLSQSIEYHIWGDSELYKNLHKDFNFMNDDSVKFHDALWQEEIDIFDGMDRIIVTECSKAPLLSALHEMGCKGEIDLYNPDTRHLDIYPELNVTSFGSYDTILTSEDIRTDNLYHLAKQLNYTYAKTYNEVTLDPNGEWDKLDSFTKGSNIASADYHDIRLLIMKDKEVNSRTLAEMEHIRWCRYHYLNHWRYGMGEDGRKDSEKKLHPCLVPFGELSEEDKEKDYEAIQVLLTLKEIK